MTQTNFNTHLGLDTQIAEPGRSSITVTIEPRMLNRAGVLHGGMMMTIMDTLMGHAAYSLLRDEETVVTSSMTTHFLEPASAGEIRGEGVVIADNGGYLLAEARLKNSRDQTIAFARGQFSRLRTP